jgi:radical SAM/Cys-rich protein
MRNIFDDKIIELTGDRLQRNSIDIIQVNLGLMCNQRCVHCHIHASSQRREIMEKGTMEAIYEAAQEMKLRYFDLTGGAPELNPHFIWFAESLRRDGHMVQVRTNLTVFFEPEKETLPEFYRDHRINIVASLPCYLEENVNSQRGIDVYEKSIAALRRLNEVGYGRDPDLSLTLVYNPAGAFLPPFQSALEADYKRELFNRFGIDFTRLVTITNMPIGRFWEGLQKEKKSDEYMYLLKNSFNPLTIDNLMCRHQVSIGWDGKFYDCDFNLALGLTINNGMSNNIFNNNFTALKQRYIVTGEHCFGCTAGAGSSCEGVLV